MVDTNSSILFPEQIRRKHPPDDDTHKKTHTKYQFLYFFQLRHKVFFWVNFYCLHKLIKQ